MLAGAGEYGRATAALRMEADEQGIAAQDQILHQARLLALLNADGQVDAGEEVANRLFDQLRTQGVNADKTVSSVIFSDAVRVWKGEPFEQALAYQAIAVQKAMRGEWDNTRAAASSSLFLLRDFSAAMGMPEPTALDLARRSAELDREAPGKGEEFLDKGYVTTQSDFALGYLTHAVASAALKRMDEASDNLRAAERANPELRDVVARMRDEEWNTVLVVEVGRGPIKVATGADGAIAAWESRDVGREALQVVATQRDGAGGRLEERATIPVAQDINAMVASHRWRNLEDVRVIKSQLGDALLAGGVISAVAIKDDQAKWVGVGIAALGILMKATSQADTRYWEFMPQRVYVVPLMLRGEGPARVVLRVAGREVAVDGLATPREGEVQLRLVRVASERSRGAAETARIVVANDAWREAGGERIAGDELPYILGGMSVELPSGAILARAQEAGYLRWLTTVELENLYREEGIALTIEDQRGQPRRHLLEGGASLVSPASGTAGYMRLFGRVPEPYDAKSERLREAQRRVRAERARGQERNDNDEGDRP